MSIRVDDCPVSVIHNVEVCSVCNIHTIEVDIEVTNIVAQEIVSLPTCILCASEIAARTLICLTMDQDDLLYLSLGTVGEEQTN